MLFVISLFFCSSAFGQTVNDLRPTVTMKEYVDMQSELNSKMMLEIIRIQIENINDNVEKANATMDKRLDGMNEFRETLKDSNSTYVTWQALIGLIIGVSGFLFGYATFRRNQELDRASRGSSSKNIQSGDKVEVKKPA